MATSLKFYFQTAIFFFCLCSLAQNSLIDRLHEMQKDPRLKEKVYVHTNKTSYFPDDVIWFKTYVGDSINYPSERTKVLNVNLFDDEGTQLFRRTVSIENGTGSGQIELSDAVAPGTYYLQARTNYMRNFGADYHFLQKIIVEGEPLLKKVVDDINYDIQLFPEGGNLVEEIDNVIAIKALANGRSIDFKGTIINERGKTITEFQSEHEGMGKCSFFYSKGEKYKAQIKVRDTVLELNVPQALSDGVALKIDTSDDAIIKISLKTNEKTFYDQVYSNYTLLFYQNRQIFDLVQIARLDSLTGLIETNKSIFLDGVQTVTLFADDKPIAERKFYIENDRKKAYVSLIKDKTESDSINYKINIQGRNQKLKADLSVSVLPASSPEFNQKNTIRSAFLLRPFVKGHIENPAYYFNIENKKRKEHLDLLLLTQGWTQYSLDKLIEEINPIEKYKFDEGFELSGSLKEETKYKNLVLIPDDLKVVDKVKLNGRSNFTFKDLNVFKGDTVRVAHQNWLGKIIKPLDIAYDTIEKKGVSNLMIPKKTKIPELKQTTVDLSKTVKPDTIKPERFDTPIEKLDGTTYLDEVIVSEKKRSQRYFERRKIIEKYKPLVRDIGKYYDIPIPEVFTNSDTGLTGLLASQGFRVQTSTNGQSSLAGHRKAATLFIDGRPITSEELPTLQLHIKDIEHFMITNLGFKGASYKGGGKSIMIFQVFTSGALGQNTNRPFNEFIIRNGYDRNKKFYAPLFSFDQERALDSFEIDWKPQLKTDKNGEAFFKIPKNENVLKYLFSIQGFSEEGHLISEIIIK